MLAFLMPADVRRSFKLPPEFVGVGGNVPAPTDPYLVETRWPTRTHRSGQTRRFDCSRCIAHHSQAVPCYVFAVERRPYVLEATLTLAAEVDPAAVGAAVTTELCGHWEHEGGCRWPHNNEIFAEGASGRASFRTLFLAPGNEEADVRTRIEKALREGPGWSVESTGERELSGDETALAVTMARTPPPIDR